MPSRISPLFLRTTPLVLGTALALLGCGSDEDPGTGSGALGGNDAGPTGGGGSGGETAGAPVHVTCETVVADADCDESLAPIVFIHGTFGSATEISTPAQLFGSNGYCQDRFVAVEYDSLGDSPLPQLEALVDEVRARTGFDQVVLAGHSQGTRHACEYLGLHPEKVSHYLNLSGGCDGAGIPSLSISSENDLRDGPVHPAPTATQERVTFEKEDHVAVAGSKNAFVAMWRYLYGSDPEHTTIQCGQDPVVLFGKAVTLGDNVPRANARIDVFELDTLSHPWERGEPYKTVQANAQGEFRVEVRRGVRYELRQWDANGTLLGYVYYAPFLRSNYLTRLLSESQNGLVKSATTDAIVRDPAHSVWAARYLGGVLRADWNNSLKIDGAEVLTDENAGRQGNVTGLFMFDNNLNKQSDLGVAYNVSFLWGTDVFIDASEPRWVDVVWTNEEGRSTEFKVPNWSSGPPASGNELDRNMAALYLPH
jgi:pimeloyl-ACP methyl ester carboxylesterase